MSALAVCRQCDWSAIGGGADVRERAQDHAQQTGHSLDCAETVAVPAGLLQTPATMSILSTIAPSPLPPKGSALRRWLRQERARVFKAGWDADRRDRLLFLGCHCEAGPCGQLPCESAARTPQSPPSHDGEELGSVWWWETDQQGTFSNVPTHGPLTPEQHLRALVDDLKAMKSLPFQAVEPQAVMPAWVLEMAVTEGWVDEAGRFTEKYWRDFRSLNGR